MFVKSWYGTVKKTCFWKILIQNTKNCRTSLKPLLTLIMSLPITFYLLLVLQIDPMGRQITTQTSPTSSMVIRGQHSSHSSEQAIRSVRSLTPTTFSTTTTTCSRRWAELMTISFRRHLAWADRHMVSEQLLGELACDGEIKNGREEWRKCQNDFWETWHEV